MTVTNHDNAEAIAIAGLTRLAADDDLMMRFCGLTGILANDIRQVAGEPGFLVGVLDFFLAYEPDLMAWAEADDLRPETIVAARHTLAPTDQSGFE